jgi:protein-S-isoprenylcysteine O-methyltransferase Ste14
VVLPAVIGPCALVIIFRSGLGPRDGVRWFGLVLALIGLSGIVLARYTLGKSFSITPQARALVTTGIYSRIRNPIYVSGMVVFIGVFLMIRNPYFWLVLLLVAAAQFLRARKEAQILEEKFGDAYREYRARTWF